MSKANSPPLPRRPNSSCELSQNTCTAAAMRFSMSGSRVRRERGVASWSHHSGKYVDTFFARRASSNHDLSATLNCFSDFAPLSERSGYLAIQKSCTWRGGSKFSRIRPVTHCAFYGGDHYCILILTVHLRRRYMHGLRDFSSHLRSTPTIVRKRFPGKNHFTITAHCSCQRVVRWTYAQ